MQAVAEGVTEEEGKRSWSQEAAGNEGNTACQETSEQAAIRVAQMQSPHHDDWNKVQVKAQIEKYASGMQNHAGAGHHRAFQCNPCCSTN